MVELIDAKDNWKQNYFSSIDELCSQVELGILESKPGMNNSIEIRVWRGFGSTYLQGFILVRKGELWSAFYIPGKPQSSVQKLSRPKSGWKKLWDDLSRNEILTLPDSSELEGRATVWSGNSYVVEILSGKKYRTYHYNNPSHQSWPEAKAMSNICDILHKEFETEQFYVDQQEDLDPV